MRFLRLVTLCCLLLLTVTAVAQQSPVAINTTVQNTSPASIIVTATCNATSAPKDLEGWVGQGATTTKLVASLSGTARQTITIVVPPAWFYRIAVAVPPGGSCSAIRTTP